MSTIQVKNEYEMLLILIFRMMDDTQKEKLLFIAHDTVKFIH